MVKVKAKEEVKEKKELKFLTREELIKVRKFEVQEVDLGDGFGIYIKEMTAHEKNQWEQASYNKVSDGKGGFKFEQTMHNIGANLAVQVLCDKEGKLQFTSGDADILSKRMGSVRMELIVTAAQKLNKITEEDKEELLKNSGPEVDANSSSASVEN